jgi:hypothetical protein
MPQPSFEPSQQTPIQAIWISQISYLLSYFGIFYGALKMTNIKYENIRVFVFILRRDVHFWLDPKMH